mmetsp:Transcript_25606/g.44733  ORF Transcript_25606/g.44733 Transcript_25606/m.44733 type:complete len:145 (+) Transcript_25606:7170-7604(+)
MSFRKAFAKSLVVMLIFVSSVHKIAFNDSVSKDLSKDYQKLHTSLESHGIKVPLEPGVVSQYSSLIIYAAAAVGILGSLLVLAEKKYGSCLLISWLLASMILHGPFLADAQAVEVQSVVFMMHWGLIAGLVLACPCGGQKLKVD